jgi:probable addiction module antidote protein
MNTTPWDVQEFLQTPEDCALYVQAAIDEAGDDVAFIAKALGDVAKSKGMAAVARDAGLTREGLYKALGDNANPSFATILRVIRALGLKVAVEPAVAA